MQIRFHGRAGRRTVRRGLTIFLVAFLGGGLLILWDGEAPSAATPTDRALQALDDSDWVAAEALLAFRLHDWGGADHWSRAPLPIPIPPADGDPITGLRAMHATFVAAPSPEGEAMGSLRQRLLDNVAAVQNSSNDAAVSFQMLAMQEAKLNGSDLRSHLMSLAQRPDGGLAWGCGGAPSLECTAFALWALDATGGVPRDAIGPAGLFIMTNYAGGPFIDPVVGQNVQATAWAIVALDAATLAVPDASLEWIWAQQDGGLWPHAGQPSPWATADALFMLARLEAP